VKIANAIISSKIAQLIRTIAQKQRRHFNLFEIAITYKIHKVLLLWKIELLDFIFSWKKNYVSLDVEIKISTNSFLMGFSFILFKTKLKKQTLICTLIEWIVLEKNLLTVTGKPGKPEKSGKVDGFYGFSKNMFAFLNFVCV